MNLFAKTDLSKGLTVQNIVVDGKRKVLPQLTLSSNSFTSSQILEANELADSADLTASIGSFDGSRVGQNIVGSKIFKASNNIMTIDQL